MTSTNQPTTVDKSLLDYEFYETPSAFSHYLFREVSIYGTVFSPCVGSGAIIRASRETVEQATDKIGAYPLTRQWVTNDFDHRWPADFHHDATQEHVWKEVLDRNGGIDFTVDNPPFTKWQAIAEHALEYSRIGVALHLRASIHEVLKTGARRTWMSRNTPTGILWLPRFGYQRSKTTGKWTTDSVCACWLVWLKLPTAKQFIRYSPEWVLDALEAETPIYRKRMDALMGRAQ